MEYLLTFHTHFDALKYSRIMKKAGYKAVLKPVPRKLSSSCGSCVVVTAPKELELEQIYNEDADEIYQVDGDNFILLKQND